MACHGGSIGGKSYVGLANSQVDYDLLFGDLFRADGRRVPLVPFTISTARGTTNAGMMAVVLLSVRNPDLSRRKFPLLLGANLPELDAPPWWNLKHKKTMYYDGRTPAASVRANMQFLLGEKTLEQFQALEPTFRDIQAYLLSLQPPQVSAGDRGCQGGTRQGRFRADLCSLPRHLWRKPVVSRARSCRWT